MLWGVFKLDSCLFCSLFSDFSYLVFGFLYFYFDSCRTMFQLGGVCEVVWNQNMTASQLFWIIHLAKETLILIGCFAPGLVLPLPMCKCVLALYAALVVSLLIFVSAVQLPYNAWLLIFFSAATKGQQLFYDVNCKFWLRSLWNSIFSIFNQNSRSPLVSTVHANCFRTVNLLFVEDITQATRHRVLKWARFGGVNFRSYAYWLARRQYVISVIWQRTKCRRVKCALLACSYHVQRHTPAAVECFDLGRSIPTAKPLLLMSSGTQWQYRLC